MMKESCGVVRDLIPLVIDSAASEDSAYLVQNHLSQCEECRAYYESATSAQSTAALNRAQREKQAFQKAARRLKIRRRAKKIALIACWVLAVALVACGLFAGWTGLLMELPSESIDAKIVQLERGTAVVLAGSHYNKTTVRYGISTESSGAMHISLETHRFGHKLESNLAVGYTSLTDGIDLSDLTSITYGRDNAALWRQGDSVTQASPQMEEYYAALDALEAYYDALRAKYESNGGAWDYTLNLEEQETYLGLTRAAVTAFSLVPEWAGSPLLHPVLPFMPSMMLADS